MSAQNAIFRIETALAKVKRQAVWTWGADDNMYAGSVGARWVGGKYSEPIIQTDGGHYGPDEETREYIAACNPVAMRALLKRLNELEAKP